VIIVTGTNPVTVNVTAANFTSDPLTETETITFTYHDDPNAIISDDITETGTDQLTGSDGKTYKVTATNQTTDSQGTGQETVTISIPQGFFAALQGPLTLKYDVSLEEIVPVTFNVIGTADYIINLKFTPGNTPPIAPPCIAQFFPDIDFADETIQSLPAKDPDGDTVTFQSSSVQDGFVIESISALTKTTAANLHGHALLHPFTFGPFSGGASFLSTRIVQNGTDVVYQLTDAAVNTLHLQGNDVAVFAGNYTVSDGHGNTASNVITLNVIASSFPSASSLSGAMATEASAAAAASGPFVSSIDIAEALYIGYYGRAGDVAGMQSTVGQFIVQGLSANAVAASFAAQAAATTLYPFLANPQTATQAQIDTFANSVYHDLFNRTTTSTELTSAETYLTANLTNTQAVDTFILNVINAAQGQDLATLENKVFVSEYLYQGFSGSNVAFNTAAGALANSVITATTSDPATVTAQETAIAQYIDSVVPSGPTVSAVAAKTDNGAFDLNAGHIVTITVTTSEPVNVTGSPTLQLSDNEVATYTGGTESNTLIFSYDVQPGDNTSDLHVTGITLPIGASIVDAAGKALGGSFAADLSVTIDTTTAPATSVQQEILGLYAALYNRAGDGSGYSFWVNTDGQQADSGGVTMSNASGTTVTLTDAAVLGQQFVNTQNTFFNQTYGGLTDSQFINALYVNLGGNAGDPGGISYWANLLAQAEAGGQSAQAARAGLVGQFVHDLIGVNLTLGAAALGLTTDQYNAALARQAAIDNKVAVSLAYLNASQGAGGAILNPQAVGDAAFNAAVTILQGVTSDHTTTTTKLVGIYNAVGYQDLSQIT
jgi:hypothetical protein